MTARILTTCMLMAAPAALRAQTPTDVPANHWARPAVLSVVQRGIMGVAGGKFQGAQIVSRRDLAITLARFGRALTQNAWPKTGARRLRPAANGGLDKPVTRYELAAAIDAMGRFAAEGLPAAGRKVYLKSAALPAAKIAAPKSDPAYASLVYLARNHMVLPGQSILKSGSHPASGQEVADGLAVGVIGENDRVTDEPQNREDLGERPGR